MSELPNDDVKGKKLSFVDVMPVKVVKALINTLKMCLNDRKSLQQLIALEL